MALLVLKPQSLVSQTEPPPWASAQTRPYTEDTKGCEEKYSNTTAHHPVVKPPAAASTAVYTLQLTQQGWGNYQELSCSLSIQAGGRFSVLFYDWAKRGMTLLVSKSSNCTTTLGQRSKTALHRRHAIRIRMQSHATVLLHWHLRPHPLALAPAHHHSANTHIPNAHPIDRDRHMAGGRFRVLFLVLFYAGRGMALLVSKPSN